MTYNWNGGEDYHEIDTPLDLVFIMHDMLNSERWQEHRFLFKYDGHIFELKIDGDT